MTDAALPQEADAPTRTTWPGVWPGTVVDTRDPDRLGRVKVRVPQLYGPAAAPAEEKIRDDALPWARPCFPVAGPDHGAFWVPEPGDPVLVLFWGGDPEHPVWLGGWPGTDDAPAQFTSSYETVDRQPRTRLIRTPNGHEVEMRWVAGQEVVTLRSAGGQEFALDDTGGGARLNTGTYDITASGAGNWSLASLALLAMAGITMTAQGGVLALVGAGITIFTTAGLVQLGVSGTTQKLVTAAFLAGKFYPHIHIDSTGGPTGPPSNVTADPSDATVSTEAN